MSDNQQVYYQKKKLQEDIEHQDVLLSISAILATKEGKFLFKYLFKNLDVNVIPDQTMMGKELYSYLGFIRAGNSVYKLACEADPEVAGSLIAKIERERYEDIREHYRIQNGLNSSTSNDDNS